MFIFHIIIKYHILLQEMLLFSNNLISPKNYFNFLLCILPISFIAGNLVINANVLILIVSFLIFFKNKIFQIKYYWFDKFLFVFFLVVLFTGFYNDYFFYLNELAWKGYFSTILKSIFFFSIYFYIVLRFLVERQVLDLKFFFFLVL